MNGIEWFGMESPLPCLLITLLLWLLAEGLARWVPFFRQVTDESAGGRYRTLDGLRGFLALGVFFLHTASFYFLFLKGWWHDPPHFYTLAGQVPVAIFFMITAFLFWSKAIAGGQAVAPLRLYMGRARRLTPVYVAAVVIACAVVLCWPHETGFHGLHAFRRLASIAVPRGHHYPVINGVECWLLLGPTWTLRYEVFFYALIPLLAFLATPRRFWAIGVFLLAGYTIHEIWPQRLGAVQWQYFMNFFFGMLAAHLMYSLPLRGMMRKAYHGLIPLAALVAIGFISNTGYNVQSEFLAFVALMCFLCGNDLFGILSTRGARLLGAASYSLYLLHLPVVYVFLFWVNARRPIAGMSPPVYWLVVLGCGVLVVGMAVVSYTFLEHPFLHARRPRPAEMPGETEPVGIAVA